MTRTPWAMLMMSSTPKISVRPTAMRAYTPPTRIPTMISYKISCAMPLRPGRLKHPGVAGAEETSALDRAGPGRLDGDDRRLRAWVARRQDLVEHGAGLVPLEHEGGRGRVLTERVEQHCALHRLQRDAAVQVGDDRLVVGAAGRVDRLVDDLADRVRLGHVGVDVGGSAAVLLDVLGDHLLALGVLLTAVPAVGHHHPRGVA